MNIPISLILLFSLQIIFIKCEQISQELVETEDDAEDEDTDRPIPISNIPRHDPSPIPKPSAPATTPASAPTPAPSIGESDASGPVRHDEPKEPHHEDGEDGVSGLGMKVPHEEIIVCHRPHFFKEAKCDTSGLAIHSDANVAKLIQVDITKLPFKLDQWLHIDVVPTQVALLDKSTLRFTHAMIQVADSSNRVLGRIAEQLPCEALGHPSYNDGKTKIQELFRNPGVVGSEIIECGICPDLNRNLNPTVPILNFRPPVEAFYVNFKLTMEEAELIQSEGSTTRYSITTLLVDDNGACHLHRLSKLEGLPEAAMKDRKVKVPLMCHANGPAFRNEQGETSNFKMNTQKKLNMSDIVFKESFGGRPNSRIVVLAREFQKRIQEYNYRVYNVDGQGYLPGEKEKERNKEHKTKVSVMRRPSVPLVYVKDKPSDHINDNRTFSRLHNHTEPKGKVVLMQEMKMMDSNSVSKSSSTVFSMIFSLLYLKINNLK